MAAYFIIVGDNRMEEKIPELLVDKLAEKVGLSVQGSGVAKLLVYGGTSTLLGQFLQLATGSASLAKLDLQGFQLQQIHREVQAVHKKVKTICNHKTEAAVDFFLRGEYEEARKSAIEGFRSAADLEHKVIGTRIKMLAEILMKQREEKDSNSHKQDSGMTIKRCLDEMFDDSMVSSCWNDARIFRIVPNNIGERIKKLNLIDELLVACYPILSYCLDWTDPDTMLDQVGDNIVLAKLHTKYLAEGEEDTISVFIGKHGDDTVRLDVYKTVSNQLKWKIISGNCFQSQQSLSIKSRPEKGGWVQVRKRSGKDKIEFAIQNAPRQESTEEGDNQSITTNNHVPVIDGCNYEIALHPAELAGADEINHSISDPEGLDHGQKEKAINLACSLRDVCLDNNEMWEDETLDKYNEIIGCNACFSDDNEDGYLYHPDCYEKKHRFFNSKTKDMHMTSRKVLKTSDLGKLSKEERIMKLKTDMSITFNTINTLLPSIPNAAGVAVAVGKGLSNYGVVNIVDEIGSLALNIGEGTTIGLGAGLAGAALIIELGYQARQWSLGMISSEEFKMKGIQAVVGTFSSFTCATIGSLIGTAVGGPGLGTFVGGVIGAIVGGVAGYTSRIIVEWTFDYDEDSRRSDLIIEAFHFLDLPALHLINEKVVEQSFRKIALECHPDSVRVRARDARERSIAEVQWQLLQHAKDVALGFLKNKHYFSQRCKEAIKKKYDPRERDMATFNDLLDSLEENITSSEKKIII